LDHTRNLYQFFVHVAYGCGSVLLQQGDAMPRGMGNFGGFLPIDNALYGPFSGMNFATITFTYFYLFTVKSDTIQFPVIKRHNCD